MVGSRAGDGDTRQWLFSLEMVTLGMGQLVLEMVTPRGGRNNWR